MAKKLLPAIESCNFCGEMPKTIKNASDVRVCGKYFYRNESLIWCPECLTIIDRQYMTNAIKAWNAKQKTNQLSIQKEIKKVLKAKADGQQ